jgi:hypothetical protein
MRRRLFLGALIVALLVFALLGLAFRVERSGV